MVNTVKAIKELYKKIEDHIPKKFKWDSDLKYTIAGLVTKALSNCRVAKNLAIQNCNGDALILLRSAYETVVIVHYLVKHKEVQLKKYKNHSQLIEYKDRLAAFERNPEFRKERIPVAILDDLKQIILKKKLLDDPTYFKPHMYRQNQQAFIDQSILDNALLLAQSLTNYFADFRVMADDLYKDLPDIYQNLKDVNSIIYNIGSQLSHSDWSGVLDCYLKIDGKGQDIIPEVDQDRIFIGITIMVDFSIGGLIEVGILPSLHPELKAALQASANKLSAALKIKARELSE